MKPYPECHEFAPCFGQARVEREGHMSTLCTVLHTTYPDRKCPFCKPKRMVTDGVEYPYKREYGRSI